MACLQSTLNKIVSEKMPTDFDRAIKAEEQDYARGSIRSEKSWSLPLHWRENVPETLQKRTTLLALYGVLLHRYVREPDIELAVLSEDNTWIGIPLHGILSLDISIADISRRIDTLIQNTIDLAKYLQTPLRDNDATSCAFLVQGNPLPPPPRVWPHISFESRIPRCRADLCLVVETDNSFTLLFNKNLFSQVMMEAMMRCWETLLFHASKDMSVRHDLVQVLSPIDANQLIYEWNQTEAHFPAKFKYIHELFEARVNENPDSLAVSGPVSEDQANIDGYPASVQELAYAELDARANRLSRYLRGLIANSVIETRLVVGIFLERSVAFYIAMLAVLKAGGAYLSIDTDYPNDRVIYMLQDSETSILITMQALALRVREGSGVIPDSLKILKLDDLQVKEDVAQMPATRLGLSIPSDTSERPCYIIYTSGSTGKPKGVEISHANALNLIQGQAEIYKVKSFDRVLQGFSTSFDASVEEIWMAFYSGAALVIGTKDVMRSGPDFPRYLESMGVTCLSTVPTLLTSLGSVDEASSPCNSKREVLERVRLIITGGEACTKDLVMRWAKGERRFFNTYGPTETTVIATYREYDSSTENFDRITIGKPMPNYQCYVVDKHLNLVPPGGLGELVIGGVSVSTQGYINLPKKTRSLFKPDHFRGSGNQLYLSGDLARFSLAPSALGEIEYFGRSDAQVKIRGYRVELNEIESVMSELPGIQSVVVDVQQQGPGTMKHLVAFVMPAVSNGKTTTLNTASILQAMRDKLPDFMMPSHIEPMIAFPTLPSGKLDRRRLPQVLRSPSRKAFSESLTTSRTEHELDGATDEIDLQDGSQQHQQAVKRAFEDVLGLPTGALLNSTKAADADFFHLGGNSMLVSVLVSTLRLDYPAVATRDVYHHSTVRTLAGVLDSLCKAEVPTPIALHTGGRKLSHSYMDKAPCQELKGRSPPSFYVPGRTTTIVADLVQLTAIYVMAAYMGLNGLSLYLLYFNYKDLPVFQLLGLLVGVSVALIPLAFLMMVVTKWLVLGRVSEGDYPLWQAYHLRFWFIQCLDNIFRIHYMAGLEGTPFASCYHRALGANIGKGVYLQGMLEGYDLVTIGDGCSLNCQAVVSAMSIEGNYLKLRKTKLGQGVTLGVRAVVQPDVTVGDHCIIRTLSLVPSTTNIPTKQIWGGSPSTFVGFNQSDATHKNPRGDAVVGALQILWILLGKAFEPLFLLPFLYLLRVIPMLSMTEDDTAMLRPHAMGVTLLHVIWLSMAMQIGVFIISTCLVAILKRILLLGLTPEFTSCPLGSWTFFRQWAADNLMDSLSVYTKQLRGSLYLPLWYRIMGARVGRQAEISAYENVCAERLTLGNKAFVADEVVLGASYVENGVMTREAISLGDRTFVGNNSVVEGGTHLPEDVLVGILTLPAANAGGEAVSGDTLLGCPPLRIRRRTKERLGMHAKTTYNPSTWLVFARYVVEGLGFLLLQLSLATCFALLYVAMVCIYKGGNGRVGLATYLLTLPLLVMGEALIAAASTLFWKWTIIGRYRPGSYPLYGTYVWRTELVERIEENLLHTHAYPLISGTVWMQLVNEAMGVKIGRRAYLEFPYFCEPDLCTVGDYLNMERTATLQAHLFQDRVRTTDYVKVGDHCSLGADSVVLLRAKLGDHCTLSSMSLVLRSEELPPHTQWHGLPAIKVASIASTKRTDTEQFDDEEAPRTTEEAVDAAGRLHL